MSLPEARSGPPAFMETEFYELSTRDGAIGHWRYADGLIFGLAEGSGGEDDGATAGALALDALADELGRDSAAPLGGRLRRALREANLALYHKRIAVPELRALGTALTATAVTGNALAAAHVGTGRLLLLRDGFPLQLTKDHTWTAEQMAQGLLAPSDARAHARRLEPTRRLGFELIVAVDVLTIELRPRDVVVQLSAGVADAIPESEIAELVSAHPPRAACQAIVRRAREEGAEGLLAVQIAAVGGTETTGRWWRLGW